MICPACGFDGPGKESCCSQCGAALTKTGETGDHTMVFREDSQSDEFSAHTHEHDHTIDLDHLPDHGMEHTLDASEAGVATGEGTTDQMGPLEVGESFGDRYRIDALLGFGGMGAVYKAWDTQVDIPVALKVVRTEAMADPAMTRQLDRRF